MSDHSFSKFMYLDTNIWSEIAGRPTELLSGLADFVLKHDLTLAVSGSNLLELYDADRKHEVLAKIVNLFPSALIKTADEVLREEVDSYPNPRSATLRLGKPLNSLLLEPDGLEQVERMLSEQRLGMIRQDQKSHAQQMQAKLDEGKDNFPPEGAGGKYTRQQADRFARFKVIENLARDHLEFLRDNSGFDTDLFVSSRILSYVIFNRYYIGERQVKRASEFGDLFHLHPLPYCHLAVMERHLCSDLKQIKRRHSILGDTHIVNIDFVRNPSNYSKLFS